MKDLTFTDAINFTIIQFNSVMRMNSCVFMPGCNYENRPYLQMFSGLLISGHEHELSTNAPQVHVTEQRHSLNCGFIYGLQGNKNININKWAKHINW